MRQNDQEDGDEKKDSTTGMGGDDDELTTLVDGDEFVCGNDDSNRSVVATARTNKGPPKMAFFRVSQSQSGPPPSLKEEPTNAHSSHHQHPHPPQDHSLLEDDIFSSLLPPSPVPRHRRSRILSLWHPDTVILARQMIRRSGNYLAYTTLLTMLIVVPTVLYRALSNRKVDIAAYHSAWVMVCGTVVLSFRLAYLHLTHWYMPQVQKYVVRIVWMVPIYAVQSYLSLRFHHHRVYLSTIRDFYEAYVIASFVYYLIELLGGQESLVQLLRSKNPALGQHTYPLCYILQPWELGVEFMLQCKHGVLQYVVFKTTATVLTFVCEFAGVYGEGRFEWLVAYPYLCFFQNISVMYALYCLVMLFHAVNEDLQNPVDWHPLGKFLCIKGVVFFTWWQGIVIFYLRDHGIIEALGSWSSLEVANGLIDYCIVIQMVGFAIAHSYTFTYTEYLPGRLPPPFSSHATATSSSSGGGGGGGVPFNGNENQNHPPEDANGHPSCHEYRPPATLPRPMKFTDALWSSTVPNETLQDIQRLRSGVDGALLISAQGAGGGLSLTALSRSSSRTDVHLDRGGDDDDNDDNAEGETATVNLLPPAAPQASQLVRAESSLV